MSSLQFFPVRSDLEEKRIVNKHGHPVEYDNTDSADEDDDDRGPL